MTVEDAVPVSAATQSCQLARHSCQANYEDESRPRRGSHRRYTKQHYGKATSRKSRSSNDGNNYNVMTATNNITRQRLCAERQMRVRNQSITSSFMRSHASCFSNTVSCVKFKVSTVPGHELQIVSVVYV